MKCDDNNVIVGGKKRFRQTPADSIRFFYND